MKKALTLVLTLCMLLIGRNVLADSVVDGFVPLDGTQTQLTDDTQPLPADETQTLPVYDAPVLPLSGMIVGIDPGHQTHSNKEQEPVAPDSKETKKKVSSGTAGVKTRKNEYEVNLEVGLKLRDALTAQGAQVIMSREVNDIDISNVERAIMMNEANVDIWLRIHCDGSDSNSETNGTTMYVTKTYACAEESYAAAEILVEEMCALTGANNRGVRRSDSYSGNNWSERPCILVEMGYMSNPEEDKKLCDDAYQDLLAQGMVNGLARWYAENGGTGAPKLITPETKGDYEQ